MFFGEIGKAGPTNLAFYYSHPPNVCPSKLQHVELQHLNTFLKYFVTSLKNPSILGKGERNTSFFMKGTSLGEFEELVLLSVGILFDDAYGLAIVDELERKTGRNIMISSVHKALVRLQDKGYLKSRMGGATSVRGGRDKRLYTLTPAGISVLKEMKEIRNQMWKEVPKMVWEGGRL